MARPAPEPDIAAVDAQLAVRGLRLRFAPALEARHEADTGARRRRDLVLAGAIAVLVFDAFLINDFIARPQVMAVAVAARLGFTALAAVLLWAIAQGRMTAAWREALIAAALPLALASAAWITAASPPPARSYDLFLLTLVLLAGNIAFPLRFVPALVTTAVSLFIAGGLTLAPGTDPSARPWVLGLLGGTAAFSLIACWRIEKVERTSYLLRLRETLRSQAAQRQAEAFAALSQTDALTGLPNRRAFDTALALQAGRPLALLLIDVDHFKRFNDHHGHPAGDEALRRVADAMRGALRDGDLLARYGGEEFVALLPDAGEALAGAAAERMRAAVESAALPRSDGAAPVITVSVGAASRGGEGGAAQVLAAADCALYAAKAAGRNCWRLAAGEPVAVSGREPSLQP